jgi:glutaredoxin 2
MMKLYQYNHCPYCVKARMIFGLKNIPFELITLLNDDEDTPIDMVGKKVVPILQIDDELAMPESMDIVHCVDALDNVPIVTGASNEAIAAWVQECKAYLYPLVMPRWVRAPLEEFATEGARAYFTKKKEASIGAFDVAIARTEGLLTMAHAHLKQLDALMHSDRLVNPILSDDDFHIFAVLRALSIVKGIAYPAKLRHYMHSMSETTGVELHENYTI